MDTTPFMMGAPEPATSGTFPGLHAFGELPSGAGDHGAGPDPGLPPTDSAVLVAAADPAADPAGRVCDVLDDIGARMADPTLHPRALGALGERYAAVWLESRGWRVLERNWRSRYGEIDIVAFCPEGRLVFVEVKTRRTLRQGTPQEAVTAAKRTNLRRAGVQWLVEPAHRIAHNGVRFDVLAVSVRDGRPLVRHIPGAF